LTYAAFFSKNSRIEKALKINIFKLQLNILILRLNLSKQKALKSEADSCSLSIIMMFDFARCAIINSPLVDEILPINQQALK